MTAFERMVGRMQRTSEVGRLEDFEVAAAFDVYYLTDKQIVTAALFRRRPDQSFEEMDTYLLEINEPELIPYIPYTLAFREFLPCAKLYYSLPYKIDLILADGCGVFHPTLSGLACAFQCYLGVNTIGVSKSHLHIGKSEVRVVDANFSIEAAQNCYQIVYSPSQSKKKLYFSCGFRSDEQRMLLFIIQYCSHFRAFLRVSDLVGRTHVGKSKFAHQFTQLSGDGASASQEYQWLQSEFSLAAAEIRKSKQFQSQQSLSNLTRTSAAH